MVKYYCLQCKKETNPVRGTFFHPHRGVEDGKVCPQCRKPVQVLTNEDKGKV